jgi:hypothetical protein
MTTTTSPQNAIVITDDTTELFADAFDTIEKEMQDCFPVRAEIQLLDAAHEKTAEDRFAARFPNAEIVWDAACTTFPSCRCVTIYEKEFGAELARNVADFANFIKADDDEDAQGGVSPLNGAAGSE